jgi:hypothetical protein
MTDSCNTTGSRASGLGTTGNGSRREPVRIVLRLAAGVFILQVVTVVVLFYVVHIDDLRLVSSSPETLVVETPGRFVHTIWVWSVCGLVTIIAGASVHGVATWTRRSVGVRALLAVAIVAAAATSLVFLARSWSVGTRVTVDASQREITAEERYVTRRTQTTAAFSDVASVKYQYSEPTGEDTAHGAVWLVLQDGSQTKLSVGTPGSHLSLARYLQRVTQAPLDCWTQPSVGGSSRSDCRA